MSDYIQRLVARTTTVGQATPVAHSRSPIASRDQRIGLPGFTAAGGTSYDHPSPSERDAGRDAAPAAQVSRTPTWTVDGVRPGSRSDDRLQPARSVRAPERASGGAEWPIAAPSAPSAERGLLRSGLPARPVGEPALRSSASASGPSVESRVPRRPAEPADSVTDDLDRYTATAPEPVAPAPTDAEPTPSFAVPTPRVPATQAVPGRPSLPGWDIAPIADTGSAMAPAEGEPRPRVEIGSIEGEVVPPPQDRADRAPTGPITAESVSQIGPLAARRPSNLRFAMRVR